MRKRRNSVAEYMEGSRTYEPSKSIESNEEKLFDFILGGQTVDYITRMKIAVNLHKWLVDDTDKLNFKGNETDTFLGLYNFLRAISDGNGIAYLDAFVEEHDSYYLKDKFLNDDNLNLISLYNVMPNDTQKIISNCFKQGKKLPSDLELIIDDSKFQQTVDNLEIDIKHFNKFKDLYIKSYKASPWWKYHDTFITNMFKDLDALLKEAYKKSLQLKNTLTTEQKEFIMLRKRIQELATEQETLAEAAEIETIENAENPTAEDIENIAEIKNDIAQAEEAEEIRDDLVETKDVVEELQAQEEVSDETVADVERVAAEQLSLIGFKMSEVCVESTYSSMSNKEKLEVIREQLEQGIKLSEMATESLWSDIQDKFTSVVRHMTGNVKSLNEAIKVLEGKDEIDEVAAAEIVKKRLEIYNNKVKKSLPSAMMDVSGNTKDILKDCSEKITQLEKMSDIITKAMDDAVKVTKSTSTSTSANITTGTAITGAALGGTKAVLTLGAPGLALAAAIGFGAAYLVNKVISGQVDNVLNIMKDSGTYKPEDVKKIMDIFNKPAVIKEGNVTFSLKDVKNELKSFAQKQTKITNTLRKHESMFFSLNTLKRPGTTENYKLIQDTAKLYDKIVIAHNELVYQITKMIEDIAAKNN